MTTLEIKTKSVLTGPDSGMWRATLGGFGAELQRLSAEDTGTSLERLALAAAIAGLSALRRRCAVELYTDNAYVSHGATAWFPKWSLFTNPKKSPVRNQAVWQELYDVAARHDIHWHGPRSKRTADILPEFKTEFVGHSPGHGSHLYTGVVAPWDAALSEFRAFTPEELTGVCTALDTAEAPGVELLPESARPMARLPFMAPRRRVALLPRADNRISTLASRFAPGHALQIEIYL
jgi:ribonuclease HI